MLETVLTVLGTLITSAGLVAVAWFTYRSTRRRDQATEELTEKRDTIADRDATIADLRSEVSRMVARIDLVDAHAENRVRDAEQRAEDRIAAVEREQERSKRREHIRDDYINELRNHIETGLGPPAPPWPKTLYEF